MKRRWLLIISLLLLLTSCASGKSYNLDDYVSIVTYGIDGQGTVKALIDPEIMDVLDEETDLSAYEISKLYDSLKLEVTDATSSLKNGDVVPLKFTYSDQYAIDFSLNMDSITIEGLPEELVLSEEDLWEMIDLEIAGLNEQAVLSTLKLESDDPAINKLKLRPDKVEYLETGDVITIDIEVGSLFEDSGYRLENSMLTYEVKELDQVVFDLSMMTSEDVERLDEIGRDTIDNFFMTRGQYEGFTRDQYLYMTDYINLVGFFKDQVLINVAAPDYEMGDLELVSVALISYFDTQNADPFDSDIEQNGNSLFLIYETTLQFDGQVYEEVKIGVTKDDLVSRNGELVVWDDSLPEAYGMYQYHVYDVRNDRGNYVTQHVAQVSSYGFLLNITVDRYPF